MIEVRIYNYTGFLNETYFILHGKNVAMFNLKDKMIHKKGVLKLLFICLKHSLPEVERETKEYSQILHEYKQMLDGLPLYGYKDITTNNLQTNN